MKPDLDRQENYTVLTSHQEVSKVSRRPIRISAFKISLFLFISTVVLLLGNLLSIYLVVSGKNNWSKLNWYTAWYLDFNNETNIPSFFSTMILMLAAVLIFVIYVHAKAHKSKDSTHWLALTFGFIFLSLDENIQIHETIAKHLTPMLPTDLNGFLHWSWVVPYSLLVLLLGFYFIPFVLRLPRETKKLFFLGGAVFVSGALGLEFFEGYFFKLYGIDHIINKILYCIEEIFEMWGVVIFIYALLHYISKLGLKLSFEESQSNMLMSPRQ